MAGIKSVPNINAAQKTLDAEFAAGANTATFNESVEAMFPDVSATNPGVFVVDRLDANGAKTPLKREYCTFTGVSGAVVSGVVKNADGSGSDQGHAVGAIVEFVPDVLWAQSVRDTFEEEHDADGTHGAITPSSIQVGGSGVTATGILDEDDMASDSAVKLASQQSIKAYVDGKRKDAAIEFIIDGGGVAITTGIKGDIEVPFACTIVRSTLLADQSGSIVVDVWKDSYANFPATDADSITASAPPTISTATNSQDTTLTGWTTSLAKGDILRFNVDSCTSITRATLSLLVEKA